MLLDRLLQPVIALPRIVKKVIVLGVDAGLCIITVWVAYYLRTNLWVSLSDQGWQPALASLIALPIFGAFGLYRTVLRYVSWEAFAGITQACLVYGILYSAIFTAFGIGGVPRTIGIIQPLLLIVFVIGSRAFARYWLGGRYRDWLKRKDRTRVLIYGAGSAGRQLAGALADSPGVQVVGLIDDNRGLRGSMVAGVKVWGPDRIAETVEQLEVTEILLAIPSASRRRRNDIIKQIRLLGVAVRTLPGLLDIAQGRVTVNDLRPLEVDDLLGRDAVVPDGKLLDKNIRGKTVLVTGAGGSIGSELCRQALGCEPARLLLVETSEYALYTIHRELVRAVGEGDRAKVELVPLLASVCDEARMGRIFEAWKPHTIYHAAAYKHVPLVEHNVCEGVRNNVLGTWVCGRLAKDHRVESFVLVSTDKAVRPTNIMGASKRLAEMTLQALAAESGAICFSMVRFGNVLGSSGSVVPLFRQQIAAGGPVTVTHREITRYFMTIPEAAQLVLQAGGMATGGEVFVLDMGEPVRIVDLAARMIELAGLRVRSETQPDGDIEIVFSGLRPGEKLFEELLIGENPIATSHPRVMMANESFLPLECLLPKIRHLRAALEAQDVVRVRALLCDLVPEYTAVVELVDWTYCAGLPSEEPESAHRFA
jgi:FlaA1/EpsC-like NDP-sugar epimerase